MSAWKGTCHRCGKSSHAHIMSMYNHELLCMDCKQEETKRPDYQKAVDKDIEDFKKRNPQVSLKK